MVPLLWLGLYKDKGIRVGEKAMRKKLVEM
jgi:hypothetical protein